VKVGAGAAGLVVGGALLAAVSCSPPPSSAPSAPVASPAPTAKPDEVAKRIEEYFTKSVTPGITLRATGIQPSEVPGWNEGVLDVDANGKKQSIPFLVSPDGKYFISGEVTDLTVDPLQATMKRIDLTGRHARGPQNAKVTIVEFSDFQCPFCSRAAEATSKLKEKYGTKIRFVFRQFPLSFHQNAQLASEAALAANEQGKFWEYHDKLFANQNALERDKLEGYAKEVGLDVAKFKKALDSKTFAATVAEDLKLGEEAAVDGTPTMFLNGARIANPTDFDAISKQIDAALAGS
jgi:protein-disulfide isomerase